MPATQDSAQHVGPYASTQARELILRDRLAIDRTVLANERTLLAYIRTALALLLVGLSFVHLPGLHPDPGFGGLIYDVAGWLFVMAAPTVVVVGWLRYRRFKADISSNSEPCADLNAARITAQHPPATPPRESP